jgi:hypothetical protein
MRAEADMSRATVRREPEGLDDALERAGHGERVVLRRSRTAVVAANPMEDFKLLREMEDRRNVAVSRQRLADPKEKRTPYQEVRKQAGL